LAYINWESDWQTQEQGGRLKKPSQKGMKESLGTTLRSAHSMKQLGRSKELKKGGSRGQKRGRETREVQRDRNVLIAFV